MERKFIRDASSQKDKPDNIRKQLADIISLEEAGTLNKAQRLQKKVLQEAYDHALKKKLAVGAPHGMQLCMGPSCMLWYRCCPMIHPALGRCAVLVLVSIAVHDFL